MSVDTENRKKGQPGAVDWVLISFLGFAMVAMMLILLGTSFMNETFQVRCSESGGRAVMVNQGVFRCIDEDGNETDF